MKTGAKRKTRREVKTTRMSKKIKSPKVNRNRESLKIQFEVLIGTCEMIEQCAKDNKIFERMINLIGKAVECSHASLFLLDKGSKRMREVASVGKKVDLIDFVRFDKGSGFSAWIAKEKRPILLSNLHRKRSGGTTRSFLAIPLMLDGEVFGVLNLSHIRAHAFEREDIEFLTLISVPVALSLERMFLHSELKRLEDEFKKEREQNLQLHDKVRQMENLIPTPQLLEGLNQKIKTPLDSITENAQFLLDSFPNRQKEKSPRADRRFSQEFKRGLKLIKSEANQITRTTEKMLKRRALW
jgi:transcriptional regulator with GAF, ATPase, and Fis domain